MDAAWGKPGTSLYSYGGFVGEVTDEVRDNFDSKTTLGFSILASVGKVSLNLLRCNA